MMHLAIMYNSFLPQEKLIFLKGMMCKHLGSIILMYQNKRDWVKIPTYIAIHMYRNLRLGY